MRSIFLALVLAGFIFSCNNAGSDKQAGNPDSTQPGPSTAGNNAPRTVNDAINDLKAVMTSGNRNNIAGLFEWPVPDTVLSVYLDDSAFQKSYRLAGDKLTKSMFMYYYDTITRFTYLSEIIELFKQLPVDSLRYKNELSKMFENKNEPCAKYYNAKVEGDEVTFTYGTIRNLNYQSKKSEDETDGCEFASFWKFRFDGNKLRFVRNAVAG